MTLDDKAVELIRMYAEDGMVAILARTMPDGDVRIIGPQIDPKSVAQMLRHAATAYLEKFSESDHALN